MRFGGIRTSKGKKWCTFYQNFYDTFVREEVKVLDFQRVTNWEKPRDLKIKLSQRCTHVVCTA